MDEPEGTLNGPPGARLTLHPDYFPGADGQGAAGRNKCCDLPWPSTPRFRVTVDYTTFTTTSIRKITTGMKTGIPADV